MISSVSVVQAAVQCGGWRDLDLRRKQLVQTERLQHAGPDTALQDSHSAGLRTLSAHGSNFLPGFYFPGLFISSQTKPPKWMGILIKFATMKTIGIVIY